MQYDKTLSSEDVERLVLALIDKMEADGQLPWESECVLKYLGPKNARWNRAYRGMVNRFILSFVAQKYGDNRFINYNGARKLGGFVKKGERATCIFFPIFRQIEKDGVDDMPPEKKTILCGFGGLNVWNVKQTNLVEAGLIPEKEAEVTFDHIKANEIEEFIAKINHKREYDRPSYLPALDTVFIPEMEHFKTAEGYYRVYFHELSHWTGHSSRLNRPGIQNIRFGSDPYAKEELTAELSSCFTGFQFGITKTDKPEDLQNHAAYLQHWIKVLKAEPKMLLEAAGEAQRAFDFLLREAGIKSEEKTEEVA